MKTMDAVELLMSAPIGDQEALKEEAEKAIKLYLRASPEKKWPLTTPTYRAKVNRKKFIFCANEWRGAIKTFTIEKVEFSSGVLANLIVELFLANGKTASVKISVIKESAERTPSEDAPFRVNATTAPPYYLGGPL